MPFYEKGDVRIHYEEAGSGFPLLVIPGGGLNSTVRVGAIDLRAPLAPGSSIDVQFLLGVQQGGSFRFFLLVEPLLD